MSLAVMLKQLQIEKLTWQRIVIKSNTKKCDRICLPYRPPPPPPLAERDQTQHPAQSFNPVQADYWTFCQNMYKEIKKNTFFWVSYLIHQAFKRLIYYDIVRIWAQTQERKQVHFIKAQTEQNIEFVQSLVLTLSKTWNSDDCDVNQWDELV